MIYSFSEQVIMSVKFIVLGMFAGIMLDASYIWNFKKKIPNIIVQLLFWVIMTFIICRAVLVISSGYLPIYTFLFFLIGYSIYYYFLKKSYCKLLKDIKTGYHRNSKKIYNVIFPYQFFRFIFKFLKKIFLRFMKLFKRKKKEKSQNKDETNEKFENDIIID